MNLKLYNTAARKKETFTPIDPDKVRMYVCGPTVYDFAHIGNARPYIVFDVLYRLLRHQYGENHVIYVRNITDVEDKINAAAAERGVPISEITEETTRVFHEDMAALNVLPPDVEPRATEHIPQMKEMIETLIANGHAYVADGHVLFDVPSMPEYGALSGRNRDEQIAGARVEVAPYKKDPADFVLWKPSASDQPGWESPWGWGRPGWHLECSAMSKQYLGETFDIHGGGVDLVFPHHENEIAQSRCAHGGAPLANVWMHNGYLTLEGEKMSKSLGNVVTVRDLLKKWHPEVIRFNMLSTHYRKPLDWTEVGLRSARTRLNRYYNVLLQFRDVVAEVSDPPAPFADALEDDLNTPRAMSVLDSLVTNFYKLEQTDEKSQLKAELLSCGDFLGVGQVEPEMWRQRRSEGFAADREGTITEEEAVAQVESLLQDRNVARKAKDFATSDRIRDELAEQGVVLEDKPDGTTDWRRE